MYTIHYNADAVRAYCTAHEYNFNEHVTYCPNQQMLPNCKITYCGDLTVGEYQKQIVIHVCYNLA